MASKLLKTEWIVPGKASVLVGGQFGSEAKGLAAAWLAHEFIPDFANTDSTLICTTNAGAQAGHTTQYENGLKFVCYHLPTTYVVAHSVGLRAIGYINAGAIIDIESLSKELTSHSGYIRERNQHTLDGGSTFDHYFIKNLWVSPFAATIADTDVDNERTAGPNKIASTGKGVGSALASKILRSPTFKNYEKAYKGLDPSVSSRLPSVGKISLNHHMDIGHAVIVEVPQGTGLSINHSGMYPFTTSRDCWVGSGLNDAGIHPSFLGPVCMVVRTFPIRVGNTVNDDGSINSSGPFYPGSEELAWGYFGDDIVPEKTTVTKRIRRIATWSRHQYREALWLNRPNIVFLTFVNYLKSVNDLCELVQWMGEDEEAEGIYPERIYSWGPNVEDCGSFHQAVAWLGKRGPIR